MSSKGVYTLASQRDNLSGNARSGVIQASNSWHLPSALILFLSAALLSVPPSRCGTIMNHPRSTSIHGGECEISPSHFSPSAHLVSCQAMNHYHSTDNGISPKASLVTLVPPHTAPRWQAVYLASTRTQNFPTIIRINDIWQ